MVLLIEGGEKAREEGLCEKSGKKRPFFILGRGGGEPAYCCGDEGSGKRKSQPL